MTTFSVIVPTYGDIDLWRPLADRALASVARQTQAPLEVLHIHDSTLAVARNRGAEEASGKYLIFVDADDELDIEYVEAMDAAVSPHADAGRSVLGQPCTLGVYPDGSEDERANLIPSRPLSTGNFMVIGTAVERATFLRVGGFWEWPALEDFCLWLRCTAAGARHIPVPAAVYRVFVTPNAGRNWGSREQLGLFQEILERHQRWRVPCA